MTDKPENPQAFPRRRYAKGAIEMREKDYPQNPKPALQRAELVNQIGDWYSKKFNDQGSWQKVSVFDLIADFIMDTRPQGEGLDVDKVKDVIFEVLDSKHKRDITITIRAENIAKAICQHFSAPKVVLPERRHIGHKESATYDTSRYYENIGYNQCIDDIERRNK